MRRRDCLFMQVTEDKYELPLFIADTIKELSELTGISEKTIRNGINRSDRGYFHRFMRVPLEGEIERRPYGKHNPKKPVGAFSDGKLVAAYRSVSDAARHVKDAKGNDCFIRSCVYGKRGYAYGHDWAYITEEEYDAFFRQDHSEDNKYLVIPKKEDI